MSTAVFHVAAVLTLLCGAGYLPARALLASSPLALAVSPLVTGLACAAAAIASVTTQGPLVVWLCAVFAVLWGASLIVLFRRRPGGAASSFSWLHLLLLVAAVAVPLLAVRRAPVDWDARSIWFFHADWLWVGGERAVEAFGNPAFSFSHPDYPPLGPATVASIWTVLGRDYELAQLTISILGASALITMSAALVTVASWVPRWMAVAAGGALMLSAYGMANGGGTNGYVDMLWAAAFAAGAIGLLLGRADGEEATLGALCIAAAMLSKNEGMVAGAVLLGLVAVVRGWRRGVVLGAAPVALTAAWVVAARAWGAEGDLAAKGRFSGLLRRDPEVLDRIGPSIVALWQWCRWELVVAALLTAVGVTVARRSHRELVGSGPIRLLAATAGCLASIALAYVISPNDITWHLRTSVDRTTLAPRLLLLVVVAIWLLVLAPSGRRRTRDRDADGGEATLPSPDDTTRSAERADVVPAHVGAGVEASG